MPFLLIVRRYRVDCLASTHGGVTPSPHSPIRVSPKSKASGAKRARNVFFDDRGFPDESQAYDQLLHNVDGGVILRKKKFPLRHLTSRTTHSIGYIQTACMAKS